MPLYINGVEYGGMAMNGYEINGAINGKQLFSSDAPSPKPSPKPNPLGNNGVLIIKCVNNLETDKQTRPTATITVPAGEHISLMDLVHQGKLNVINSSEWFDGNEYEHGLNTYDFPLKPGQTLEMKVSVSSL